MFRFSFTGLRVRTRLRYVSQSAEDVVETVGSITIMDVEDYENILNSTILFFFEALLSKNDPRQDFRFAEISLKIR